MIPTRVGRTSGISQKKELKMLTNNDDGQTDGQPDYNQMPPEALAKEAQRLKDLSAEVETKQRQLESERKQEQDEFARTVTESLVAKAFRECGATFTTDDRTELNKLLSTVAAVSLNENGVGLKVRDRATGQMTTIPSWLMRRRLVPS
jgi:ribosomal protein S25